MRSICKRKVRLDGAWLGVSLPTRRRVGMSEELLTGPFCPPESVSWDYRLGG
jgi:hypothetical protein